MHYIPREFRRLSFIGDDCIEDLTSLCPLFNELSCNGTLPVQVYVIDDLLIAYRADSIPSNVLPGDLFFYE